MGNDSAAREQRDQEMGEGSIRSEDREQRDQKMGAGSVKSEDQEQRDQELGEGSVMSEDREQRLNLDGDITWKVTWVSVRCILASL